MLRSRLWLFPVQLVCWWASIGAEWLSELLRGLVGVSSSPYWGYSASAKSVAEQPPDWFGKEQPNPMPSKSS